MTTLVALFLAVGSFALGLWVGWYFRGRPESAPAVDPEVELRELREAHVSYATRIRTLHLELAQLESVLAMAGVDTPRLEATDPDTVLEVPTEAGAARLASLITALGHRDDVDTEAAPHGPAAFMSILPADIVEEAVRNPPTDMRPAAQEIQTDVEPAARTADRVVDQTVDGVVISLPEDTDDSHLRIEVRPRDDLKLIRGIGPKIESILHENGITTFRQVAELDDSTIDRLGETLASLRGRIERDDWVGSARDLMSESTVSS
jgi:predicted flap endonuclease-1-like 5' DNA nuclease